MRQAEAALAIDQAAIDAAKLNLGYTEIRAPFAGRLGRNQAPMARWSAPGRRRSTRWFSSTRSMSPSIPSESDLVEIEKARAAGKVEAEFSCPARRKPSRKGELTFLDNTVDRATGTIAARATIANPDFHLLPGQYVRVRLRIERRARRADGAAGRARLEPDGQISSMSSARATRPSSGSSRSARPTASSSASPAASSEGDRVIVGNLQKIGPGSPVQPVPAKLDAKS